MTTHCCQDGRPHPHSHQLVNHIVDCNAALKPQALFAEFPVAPTSVDEGFTKITYGKLANAVDTIAWWLVDNLGYGTNNEVLAYIGPNDLTYPALILGAVKAGYTTLLLSPRNSLEAQQHLLKTLNCKVFIKSDPCPPPVNALLKTLDDSFKVLNIPSAGDLLKPGCKPFLWDVSFEDVKHQPLTIMHTSGTTGLPKPITWNHAFIAACAKQFALPPPKGRQSVDLLYQANRIFLVFPPFHAAYIGHMFCNGIPKQTALIFPLKAAIPSAQALAQLVKTTKVDAAFVVPVIVEEMSRSPQLLEDIASRIDFLVYAGGDVPKECGDVVANRVPLLNFYGSTELGSIATTRPEGEISRTNWKYLCFNPRAGVEFRHHADDMYELCLVRQPHLEANQPYFHNFRDEQEFRTRDLFKKHATEPNLWSHCGRADDTIVFLTGEKVVPVDIEQYIFSQNSEIAAVLLSGSQRFQPALLIELAPNDELHQTPKADLIERYWPSIKTANTMLPGHAQIAKSHIVFLDPSLKMIRTPKGTVQRATTLKLLAKDIDNIYDAADQLEEVAVSGATEKCDLQDTEGVCSCVRSIIENLTGQTLDNEDNFFVQGMDSMQSLMLIREMRRQVSSITQLEPTFVYAHPTVRSLVDALQQVANGKVVSKSATSRPTFDQIDSTLKRYTAMIDQLPASISSEQRPLGGPAVYILTGSTGSLGSYILETLMSNQSTAHVYCLNRSASAEAKQRDRHTSSGLSTTFSSDKVTFLTADLSLPTLGLAQETYTTLSRSVTHIIHNAWSVNFNVPLSSFEPQLAGVKNLVQFATSCTKVQRPSMLYVSSISAVSSSTAKTIPETLLTVDTYNSAPMGYGASKYISEHLLAHAANRFDHLDIRIARVGQIAGPIARSGTWNNSEWLPSLIRSSAEIGAIPSSLGSGTSDVDWIPVDVLAVTMLELLLSNSSQTGKGPAKFFNLVNPSTVAWSALLPGITAALSTLRTRRSGHPNSDDDVNENQKIQVVPFADWITTVRTNFEQAQEKMTSATPQTMEALLTANPAAKLLDFYEDCNNTTADSAKVWETTQSTKDSQTLAKLGPINVGWMEKWMAAWL